MAVTPNYSWPVPVATDFVKDGWEAISDLGNAIDTTVAGLGSAGLEFISSTTVGSAVATVTVSDVFSATYQNYRILLSNIDASGNTYIGIRFSGSGSGATAYKRVLYSGGYTGGALGGTTSASANLIQVGLSGTNSDTSISFDVLNPFGSAPTGVVGLSIGNGGMTWAGGLTTADVSETGFTILPDSGTLTGGTIKVYGYKD